MDEDLKEVILKNKETLDSLDERLRKIEKHFRTEAILNLIKWVIIVVPIVFGVIYISPYVKTYVRMLQPALHILKLDELSAMLETNSNVPQDSVGGMLESLCDPAQREVIVNQYCK